MSELLLRLREPISATGSLALLLMLLYAASQPSFSKLTPPAPPIELTLIEQQDSPPQPRVVETTAAQPAPVIPTGNEAPRPLRHKRTLVEKTSTHQTIPTTSSSLVEDEPHAIPAFPTPTSPATNTQDVPPSPAEARALTAPAPPTPSSHADDSASAESAYVEKIRAHLKSIKRYPTGRAASLQRPSGTSVVWFALRRNGELMDAGVESTSGTMLLDNAALATVRSGSYAAFPEDAWPGKEQQRFNVELDFAPVH